MILVSIFRDSQSYLDRYWEQTDMLRWRLADKDVPLSRVMVEGDSTDETYKCLEDNLQAGDRLLKVEHGGPVYRSQNITARWRQIALAANVAMTAAARDNINREPVVYMESDLIWAPVVVLKLLNHLVAYPAVSPMSMQGARFYDVWGYVKDDRYFSPWPPYHPGLKGKEMVTIDSAGSCIAMRPEVADVVEFSLTDCIRGVGRTIYQHGHSLWLDPTIAVRHP